jgi:hypothetical protein
VLIDWRSIWTRINVQFIPACLPVGRLVYYMGKLVGSYLAGDFELLIDGVELCEGWNYHQNQD